MKEKSHSFQEPNLHIAAFVQTKIQNSKTIHLLS